MMSSLNERLISWAQNEEMVNISFTEHGIDCIAAAEVMEKQGAEIKRLRDIIYRASKEWQSLNKKSADLLQAENERFRAYKTEIEHWIDLGERMIEPAAQWGPDGNVIVQTSTMFKLGAWWADRPWRDRETLGEGDE